MQGGRGWRKRYGGRGWETVAVLVILAVSASISGVAFGQALDLSNEVDLAVEVTADREGCTLPNCVRLRISVQNLATRERFVPRDLVDARRLRLTNGVRELRLEPRSGAWRSDVRERLDGYGGKKDRLVREYEVPSCCEVLAGAEPLDTLPPGTYKVQYEGVMPSEGSLGDSKAALRSAPILFMIRDPGGAGTPY